MAKRSQLEQFLESEHQAGSLESEGRFTISGRQALEKLAAFQLPFDHAWGLKVIQAAVAGGARSLRVKQSRNDLQFLIDGLDELNGDAFEQAFFDPKGSADPALDHLKQGLWNIGLHHGHPFHIAFGQATDSLVWTGSELKRLEVSRRTGGLWLTVSHRRLEEHGLSVRDYFQAARANAEVLKMLADLAFTCPIPLTVDGRRVDVLQLCPTQGVSKVTYPFHVGWIEVGNGRMRIPPGTFEGFVRPPHGWARELCGQACRPDRPAHREVSAVWMVAAHIGVVDNAWTAGKRDSYLYWVRDGVVIQMDKLPFEELPVTLGLMISADGLPTDVTGFSLALGKERRDRLATVAKAVVGPLAAIPAIRLDKAIRRCNRAAEARKLVTVAGYLGGAGLWMVNPLLGTGAMAVGSAAWTQHAAFMDENLPNVLNAALRQLKGEWARYATRPERNLRR